MKNPMNITIKDLCAIVDGCKKMGVLFQCGMHPLPREGKEDEQKSEVEA